VKPFGALPELALGDCQLAGSYASDRVTVDVADDRLDFQIEHGAPEQVKEEAGATHSA
jgi:hypothetical protein